MSKEGPQVARVMEREPRRIAQQERRGSQQSVNGLIPDGDDKVKLRAPLISDRMRRRINGDRTVT